MKWLLVENSIDESGRSSIGSETWAAGISCGVVVRHMTLIHVPGERVRVYESMLYIHGGDVHDLGDGRGQLVGA